MTVHAKWALVLATDCEHALHQTGELGTPHV